ncbi:TPA: hypothetical protein N0F65_012905 [Lagenidium giganteum]|uniref:Uncharacterized protein n=1 Tax=Lagenidium giganteum TaxID=4803 RepID=A0AAV2YS40_9STRA|nr:TPA: hypothetical protein N0F65_012905 [Lagenidium giganteum]
MIEPKAEMIDRIKENFYRETLSFRKRIKDASEETARAREKILDFQDDLLRWKRRCAKLQKALKEKDVLLVEMQAQASTTAPQRLDAMLGSVQGGMSNQKTHDIAMSAFAKASASQVSVDARLHEYEKQVAALYTEINEEKQRRIVVEECLREQKHANSKLMKACKVARQEIERLKNSGVTEMLDDLQGRCCALEQDKAVLSQALSREQAKMLRERERERQELVDQLRLQQYRMDNLEADFKNSKAMELAQWTDETAQQRERSQVNQLRAESEELREQLKLMQAQLYHARETQTSQTARAHSDAAVTPFDLGITPAITGADELAMSLQQANVLRTRLAVLVELTQTFKTTGMVDLALMAQDTHQEEPEADAALDMAEQASTSLAHACRGLAELQLTIEDSCAVALGTNCAMQ